MRSAALPLLGILLLLSGHARAEEPWTPFSHGIRSGWLDSPETRRKLFEWGRERFLNSDCSDPLDTRYVSKQSLFGWRMGDLCLLPAENRKAILAAVGENIEKAIAAGEIGSDGEPTKTVLGSTPDIAKPGAVFAHETGWMELGPPDEGVFAAVTLATLYAPSDKAYVVGIGKLFCGTSKSNALEPDNPFGAALLRRHGKPSSVYKETIPPSTDKALLQAMDRQRADLAQELRAAKSAKAPKAKIAEIQSRADGAEALRKLALSSVEVVDGYRWTFPTEQMDILRAGHCPDGNPRFVTLLRSAGPDGGWPQSVFFPAFDAIQSAIDASARR